MDEESISSQNDSLTERKIKVSVSYLEIYNENVNDLLDTTKKNLDVRETKERGIYIENLSEFEVSTLD
jgi:kinesin family protein 15